MKRKITLSILFCAFIISANAQEKNTYASSLDTQASLYGKSGLKTIELGVDLGYNITNLLSAWVRFEESIGLFNINKTKSYRTSETLGGVIGFNVLRTKVGSLTIKALAGSTIGGSWKYTYYSGGAYFNFTLNKTKPVLGFGVRHYDSRTNNFDSYTRVYCSLGFRIN